MTQDEREKLDQVYNAVMEMKTALVGTLQIPGAIPELRSQVATNTKDIATLQRWRWIIVGMASGLGYLLKHVVNAVTIGNGTGTPFNGR